MSSTISDWVDVRIVSRLDAGEVLGLLDDPAVQGGWQEGETLHLYWPSEVWSPDQLMRLTQILRQLDGANEPEIQVHALPHQDWNQLWAQSVKPLRVGKRMVVRPSWEPVTLSPGQFEIILDPKQAFGTGHHATTRMLLEWLEDIVQGGESVLDVGTGSGLLAMAALRLGAARAVGIDHDPVAIDCAHDYAVLNRFGVELSLLCSELNGLSEDRSFDLVLANLDRQTLRQFADQLAGRTGIRLLVSGLLVDQREEVAAALTSAGLYPGRQREQEGWLAVEFLRSESCEGV
ncbi:MAG: 50S ribosomal protein L11 methyltransferase [Nitrospira sp.]|nr:50S ribosomal protein L11 methyltransferase [Nitrospira sp.]